MKRSWGGGLCRPAVPPPMRDDEGQAGRGFLSLRAVRDGMAMVGWWPGLFLEWVGLAVFAAIFVFDGVSDLSLCSFAGPGRRGAAGVAAVGIIGVAVFAAIFV